MPGHFVGIELSLCICHVPVPQKDSKNAIYSFLLRVTHCKIVDLDY